MGRALIFLLIFAGTVGADGPGSFNIRAGLGYDFISQEYFYDSLRYTETDTALQLALLKKDYLDDKKAFLYLNYGNASGFMSTNGYRLETGWEQTDDLYRLLGSADFLAGGRRDKIEGLLRYERKERIKGATQLGEEINVIRGDLAYRRDWTEIVESKVRVYAENISFDSVGSYIYDYFRSGFELGADFTSPSFNTISVSSVLELRDVPDSSQLDYRMIRGNIGFLGIWGAAQISADFGLEAKDFDLPNNGDDYLLWTVYATSRIDLERRFFIKPKLSLEYFNFATSENIYDDYYLARFELLPGRELSNFSLALGPRIEILNIQTGFDDDDYFEYGLPVAVDFFHTSGIFIMFENELGRRSYLNNPDYTSDFVFDRVNLIASLNIFRGLSADLLLTADWEWHKIASDDSRIYLTSAGLSYSF